MRLNMVLFATSTTGRRVLKKIDEDTRKGWLRGEDLNL